MLSLGVLFVDLAHERPGVVGVARPRCALEHDARLDQTSRPDVGTARLERVHCLPKRVRVVCVHSYVKCLEELWRRVDVELHDGDQHGVGSVVIELEVVAEGIERVSELDTLREMGCGLAQGYLIARPTLPDDPTPMSLIEGVPFELSARVKKTRGSTR